MQTLKELADECQDVEFIARRGRYALVRLPSATGGEVRLVSRTALEHWMEEDGAAEDMFSAKP